MVFGPGKYDALASHVREQAEAESVLLIVFDGKEGPGFNAQVPSEKLHEVPAMLRVIASQIELDAAQASLAAEICARASVLITQSDKKGASRSNYRQALVDTVCTFLPGGSTEENTKMVRGMIEKSPTDEAG